MQHTFPHQFFRSKMLFSRQGGVIAIYFWLPKLVIKNSFKMSDRCKYIVEIYSYTSTYPFATSLALCFTTFPLASFFSLKTHFKPITLCLGESSVNFQVSFFYIELISPLASIHDALTLVQNWWVLRSP